MLDSGTGAEARHAGSVRTDFRREVRRRLPETGVSGVDDAALIEELAGQIEEIYDSLITEGWTSAEARVEALAALEADPSAWEAVVRERPPGGTGSEFGVSPLSPARPASSPDRVRDWFGRPLTSSLILTLAATTAITVAVFALLDATLWAPLPFPKSDRVMFIANQFGGPPHAIRTTVPDYFDRIEQLTVFEELAMFRWIDLAIDAGSGAERVRGTVGTPSLLRLTQVPPLHGRIFDEGEGTAGSENKIVFSYELWQELFDGDVSVIGTTVSVDGRPFEVVGIMPLGFGIFRLDARFWIPAVYTDAQRADERRNANDQYQIGRLKPGATPDQARAELDALNALILQRYPELRETRERNDFYVSVDPIKTVIMRENRPTLLLLGGGGGMVLLVGMTNLAGLMIARSHKLQPDLTTCLLLGARRLDLARRFAADGLLHGVAGGVIGLAGGAGLIHILRNSGIERIPLADTIRLGTPAVLFLIGIVVLAGLIITLAPTMSVSGPDIANRTRTAGKRTHGVRRGLVIIQISVAFVLLAGGGTMLSGVRALRAVNPGFESRNLISASFDVSPFRYSDSEQVVAFVETLVEQARQLPGVEEAGTTQLLPFGGRQAALTAWPEHGARVIAGEHGPSWYYVVSTGYLEAMRTKLVHGRYFVAGDTRNESADGAVAIVDEIIADRFWPDRSPLGERLYFGANPDARDPAYLTVVGVVETIRHEDLAGGPNPAIYVPLTTTRPERAHTLVVRSTRGADEIGTAIQSLLERIDSGVPVYDIMPMRQRTEDSLAALDLSLTLTLMFSLTAIGLATAGVYGTQSLLVSLRRREFGIRIALGCTRRTVMRMVIGESSKLAIGGIVCGLPGVLLIPTLPSAPSWVGGGSNTVVVALAGMLVAFTAVAASIPPALRATRAEPIQVLGQE